MGARSCSTDFASCPRLQDVNTDLQITSPQIMVDIDRDKAATLGVSADQIESALDAAYGAQQVSTIYTPSNQYWVILEVDPQYQRDPTALGLLYVRSTKGQLVPLGLGGQRPARRWGPLTVNHLGQLAGGDHLVQHEARRLAQRRGGRGREGHARAARARHRERDVPGHGAGVPGLAAGAGDAAADHDPRDLPGARHALRELHPPADDPVRPAVGGRGRAAHAAALPDGAQRLRLRGHDHADRHREEERDHDDRLRPRRRARRRRRRPRRSTRAVCCASGRS